jgi:hypothetical protein
MRIASSRSASSATRWAGAGRSDGIVPGRGRAAGRSCRPPPGRRERARMTTAGRPMASGAAARRDDPSREGRVVPRFGRARAFVDRAIR